MALRTAGSIVIDRDSDAFKKVIFQVYLLLEIKSFGTMFIHCCCQTIFKQFPIHSQDIAHTNALYQQCRKLVLVFYRELENKEAGFSFYSLCVSRLSLCVGPALVIEVNVLLKSGVTATVSDLEVHQIYIPFNQASSLYCFTISLLTPYCISVNKLKF